MNNVVTLEQWLPMDTAPEDGTTIIIKTAGGYEFKAFSADGFLNSNEEECRCWCAVDEGSYPDCWSGGVCWAVNEDLNASDPPVAWKPITSVQKEGNET